jgi:transposase-like protein
MSTIRTYTKSEIAGLYGISPDTLRKWLLPLEDQIQDLKNKKLFSPKEVKIVFEHLGSPFDEAE